MPRPYPRKRNPTAWPPSDLSPRPAPAALPGTVADTFYAIQNQSEDLLFAATAIDAPDPAAEPPAPKVIIPPYHKTVGGTVSMKHEAGESIWLWSRPFGPDIETGWDEE